MPNFPITYRRTSLRVMIPSNRPFFPPRFSSSYRETTFKNKLEDTKMNTHLSFHNDQSVDPAFLDQLQKGAQ